MIRIDEIYYNTFLPKMQDKPLHGLHWFDPFGSVKFEDLCNIPPVDDGPDAVRYLFWDQEPLHQDFVDITLSKFMEIFYKSQRHIIVSERDSDTVNYVVRTYGFIPHYYFFHGWAALDWFRGYDRSFLMPDVSARRITKTFIMPNRIIAGERKHRLIMLYHIFKLGMTNNHISCPAVCPAENINVDDAIKDLFNAYPDIKEVFDTQQFPMTFAGETDAPMHSYQLSLFGECAESLIYLVTETVATGRRQHLTEKTFKPIALKMPFVIVGTCGSLEYLRSYGFKTFGHLWDETYDEEPNDLQRYEKIAKTLKDIDELPRQCKQKLLTQAQDIIEHNYNHFYNGGFEDILWDELKGMINEF
jgi:hypothetical protein